MQSAPWDVSAGELLKIAFIQFESFFQQWVIDHISPHGLIAFNGIVAVNFIEGANDVEKQGGESEG